MPFVAEVAPVSELDALLAGIIADPENDLPRLMMADALDEAGEHARGEFIRVQCELDYFERWRQLKNERHTD